MFISKLRFPLIEDQRVRGTPSIFVGSGCSTHISMFSGYLNHTIYLILLWIWFKKCYFPPPPDGGGGVKEIIYSPDLQQIYILPNVIEHYQFKKKNCIISWMHSKCVIANSRMLSALISLKKGVPIVRVFFYF